METYTILHWARTTYAGFNDTRLCEKLRKLEGFSFGRARSHQSLASRSRKPRSHLLLPSPTLRQQRQRRARGWTPLANPAPAASLELRRGHSAALRISPWIHRHLL